MNIAHLLWPELWTVSNPENMAQERAFIDSLQDVASYSESEIMAIKDPNRGVYFQ